MRKAVAILLLGVLSMPAFGVERKQTFKVMPQELYNAALGVAHRQYRFGIINNVRMLIKFNVSEKSGKYFVDAAIKPNGTTGSELVLKIVRSAARRRAAAGAEDRIPADFFHAVKMELEMNPARVA